MQRPFSLLVSISLHHLRQCKRVLPLADSKEQLLPEDCLRGVRRQLEVVEAGVHAGERDVVRETYVLKAFELNTTTHDGDLWCVCLIDGTEREWGKV